MRLNPIQRIAKNSLAPMAAQVINKVADALFAIYVLRILGVDGAGRYAFAVITWLYLKTISDFGLGVLGTREVAQHPDRGGLWLGGGTTVRLLVLLGLLPMVAALLAGYAAADRLAPETAVAIVLLVLSIAPSAFADSATAICHGRERMETPALVTVLSTALKIVVAGLALALGYGVVGLAAAAVVVNIVTAAVLWRLARPLAPGVQWWPGGALARHWLLLAWPLLLNGLLVNLFFRLDTFIIQATRDDAELGLYDAAYKFINVTLIVPPYVTLALFPRLARQAEREPAALRRTLQQASGYLLMLALPAAVATTVLSGWLIWLMAGPSFLPGSAAALQVLIWFLPFSYVNGLLQYGLIALERQRAITAAFALTVSFNLVANLLIVPSYGYLGAAAVTVATEVVLLAPLLWLMRRAVGPLGLAGIAWRPVVATALMALVIAVAAGLGPWPAVLLGSLAYGLSLLALGAWGDDERRLARALLGR
ncbi:MAG: flippase [Chloroflexi bacterium]|nr:flippase [Chloroflexota bacterium]